MGKWVKGDLHVHTQNCNDGTLSVDEIIRRSKEYIDFIGISGHSYDIPDCFEGQYAEVLAAREKYPELPIFHTAEQNFPLQRHTMFVTVPENKEFALQRELVQNFHRQSGHEGQEEACCELRYVKEGWGEESTFMIYNHPNDPDVPIEDFRVIAKENDVFKVIACVDRGERRAKQTWEIGEEWDKLLCEGYRLYARNGSDFHQHFTDGGHDYFPGEFVQDCVYVEENNYEEILRAYRNGRFYCTVGNCIENPVFTIKKEESGNYRVHLSLTANVEMEQIDLIADGKCVCSFNDIPRDFSYDGVFSVSKYFRVRGWGKGVNRKYREGQYTPQFLLNPIFVSDCEV
ncbi:MAG: hypothetical protein J6A69_08290 [Clostridia bacterium]|nr:hypothetical protein [Clostridia bacterium]